MVYRVALVGHSQLPEIDDYDNVEFEHFKIRGARISTFEESEYFDYICSNAWNCVIIFLGGNDLCDHHSADQVVNDLLNFVDQTRARTVLVTKIEKRTYRRALERRYNTTTVEYNSLANTANNKLRRRERSRGTFHLIHCPPAYNLNSIDQGIHFDEIATRSLINRYEGAIRNARKDD